MTLLASLLSLAGFAALALAMPKHHRDMFGRPLRATRRLATKAGGWLQLTVSLICLIVDQGILVGIVLWLGIATVTALVTAMGLAYARRDKPRNHVA